MLAVNVQESTTTTGTGDITLAGASEDGRTFTSQFITEERFSYFVDDRAGIWESGIGYLSGSTTLVREKLLESSTGSTINLTGTNQVFVGAGTVNSMNQSSVSYSNLSGLAKFAIPSNVINKSAAVALVADRIAYVYAYMTKGSFVDSLAVRVNTGAGTGTDKIHLGIYEINPLDCKPAAKLASAVDLDPSVAGFVSGTFTEIFLQAGWYYFAVWSNVAPMLRASPISGSMSSPFTTFNDSSLTTVSLNFVNGQTSLSDLPAVGNATNADGFVTPIILVGHS